MRNPPPPAPAPRLTRYPHGVTAVDTEYQRPGFAAAHIIQHAGRAAFVDAGTNHSVPSLLEALRELAIAPEAVDYLLLTHVHLDHAGGAGALIQALPNAVAVLHPRGGPHMIDPGKLIAGSREVYGEARFQSLYGNVVPIPAERVRVTREGERLGLAGREFEILHTPGHALHHQVFVDLAHASIFTGDTFGISYRELDSAAGAFIAPTTTPTQFDPDQLSASIDRMLAYTPETMYLTHYSRVTDVARLADSLKCQVREFVEIAKNASSASDPYAAILDGMWKLWLELAHRHGCPVSDGRLRELLAVDLDLNSQGLLHWLRRRSQ